MYQDADGLLRRHLEQSPEARREWERSHKLRHDPRVTPVGRLLRRLSLDELPQLWNVVYGDMSLVGPRPIVAEEVPAYGRLFSLYTRVHPGLTGLWQVSGRNAIPFLERVELDAFYVRNWSVWLDLYVLMRTVRAVLGAEGAY
jgi:lipopolysaccharide/colanic/teichoic acid biosynthesis glycosyltransferase